MLVNSASHDREAFESPISRSERRESPRREPSPAASAPSQPDRATRKLQKQDLRPLINEATVASQSTEIDIHLRARLQKKPQYEQLDDVANYLTASFKGTRNAAGMRRLKAFANEIRGLGKSLKAFDQKRTLNLSTEEQKSGDARMLQLWQEVPHDAEACNALPYATAVSSRRSINIGDIRVSYSHA